MPDTAVAPLTIEKAKPAAPTIQEDTNPDPNTKDRVKAHAIDKVETCKCGIQGRLPGGREGACNKINAAVDELAKNPTGEASQENIDRVRKLLLRLPDKSIIEHSEIFDNPDQKIINAQLISILEQIKKIRIRALYKVFEDAIIAKSTKQDPSKPSIVPLELRKAVIELLEEEKILNKNQLDVLRKKVDSKEYSLQEFQDSLKEQTNPYLAKISSNISRTETRIARYFQDSAPENGKNIIRPATLNDHSTHPRFYIQQVSSGSDYVNGVTDSRNSSSFHFADHTIAKDFEAFVKVIVEETLRRHKEEEKESRETTPAEERKAEEDKLAFVAGLRPELKRALAYVQLQFADIQRLSNGEIVEMLERILHAYNAHLAIAQSRNIL